MSNRWFLHMLFRLNRTRGLDPRAAFKLAYEYARQPMPF